MKVFISCYEKYGHWRFIKDLNAWSYVDVDPIFFLILFCGLESCGSKFGVAEKNVIVSAQDILGGLNKAISLVGNVPSVAGIFASMYRGKTTLKIYSFKLFKFILSYVCFKFSHDSSNVNTNVFLGAKLLGEEEKPLQSYITISFIADT